MSTHDAARAAHERAVADLVGRRVTGVTYWDIHDYGHGREWDFGDWHLAVMGVELGTDRGPLTITWDDTFTEYGAEIWPTAFSEHVAPSPEGPDGWPVGDHSRWQRLTGSPVRAARIWWYDVDPDDETDAGTLSVPVGLRLDFDAGPVWFLAAQPDGPDGLSLLGDEIVVAFAPARLGPLDPPPGFAP